MNAHLSLKAMLAETSIDSKQQTRIINSLRNDAGIVTIGELLAYLKAHRSNRGTNENIIARFPNIGGKSTAALMPIIQPYINREKDFLPEPIPEPPDPVRRDMFAAHALAGFLSQRVDSDENDRSLTFLAQLSYRMADAMIFEASIDRTDSEV